MAEEQVAAAMGKAPPVASVAAGAAALGLTMGGVMQAVGMRAAAAAPAVPVRLDGFGFGLVSGLASVALMSHPFICFRADLVYLILRSGLVSVLMRVLVLVSVSECGFTLLR